MNDLFKGWLSFIIPIVSLFGVGIVLLIIQYEMPVREVVALITGLIGMGVLIGMIIVSEFKPELVGGKK